VINQLVDIRISILQGSASGTAVYVETHNDTTDMFGLLNMQIGTGAVVTGNFANIPWGSDTYFVQTEIDATGNNNYELAGTSQFLSVPYALYANKSADSSLWSRNGDKISYNHGNVGIGILNPGKSLDVENEIQASQSIRAGNNFYSSGTGYVFGSTVGEGEYLSRTGNDISIFAGGSEVLTIDGDAGNVGIGTTNPSGSFHLFSSTGSPNLKIESTNTGPTGRRPELTFVQSGVNQWGIINEMGSFRIQDWTTPGAAWTMLRSSSGSKNIALAPTEGNVGIGILNPTFDLDVSGDINFSGNLYNNGSLMNIGDGNSLDAADGNPVDVVFVDNNGNVGIGTTMPNVKLDVNGVLEVGPASRGAHLISTDEDNFLLHTYTNIPNANLWIGYGDGAGGTDDTKEYLFMNGGRVLVMNGNVGIGITLPSERLEVDGTIKATSFQGDGSQLTNIESIPTGVIVMWSGSIATIPAGWALCDGNNGTPDLTDRFVIHADADIGGTNNVGDVGGEHQHTLSIDEMPPHNHNMWNAIGGSATAPYGVYYFLGGSGSKKDLGNVMRSSGNGLAHENRPKYFALAFIMKL